MDQEMFRRDGALRLLAVFDAEALGPLRALPTHGPGVRLHDPNLAGLIEPATAAATALLGATARPVRAVLFDKTAEANWFVAWHQDRTVPVKTRREVDGFGPWSRKDGAQHVAPPVAILERMATLRIHIDPIGPENAPLKVALGSHRTGLVPADQASATAAGLPQIVCLAEPGDVWAYSTPILHASDKAKTPSRRRVLQVDYAAFDLPSGLEWAGIG